MNIFAKFPDAEQRKLNHLPYLHMCVYVCVNIYVCVCGWVWVRPVYRSNSGRCTTSGSL